MKDLVSVVVPVYNVERCIVNTLESIVYQTYKDIELILVNDGTPDKSIEVASTYLSDKDIDWRVIEEPNSGLPTARNNGIKAATGKWVICPDSDDYLVPEAIERMVDAAQKTGAKCVFCGYKIVHDEDLKRGILEDKGVKQYPIQKLREMFFRRKLILLAPGMLLERSLYDTLQYDAGCLYDEDIHFMWRLFYHIDNIAYIDADFYNYYMRSTSMVHSLKPKNYLAASERYHIMTQEMCGNHPDDKLVHLIYPKYRLGGAHVLARSTEYKVFKETIISDGYRHDMRKLVFQADLKLSAYALLYCLSLKLFYNISRQ